MENAIGKGRSEAPAGEIVRSVYAKRQDTPDQDGLATTDTSFPTNPQ